jgi:hypothetical protein
MEENIKFQIILKHIDPNTGRWTSDALRIPGVQVKDIYHNERKASHDDYEVSDRGIRWTGQSQRPSEIAVDLELTISKLTKDLSDLSKSEWRLKILSSILGIATLCLGIIVTINNDWIAKGKYSTVPKPSSQSTSTSSDWLVCWHGKQVGADRIGYEYLIAYPISKVENRLDLYGLEIPFKPNEQPDKLAHASLKMCYLNGSWYGGDKNPKPWFPKVNSLQVKGNQVTVFTDGGSFLMPPGSPPSIASLYKEPSGDKRVYVLNSRKTDSSGN